MTQTSITPPTKITVHTQSKTVDLWLAPSQQEAPQCFTLSAEFLRVHSPSAEVQRHGNPEVQSGKKEVTVHDATLVGRYGVKFHFDDGHNTGIYTWPYIHRLCHEKESLWETYLRQLHDAGKTRDKDKSVVKFFKK